MMDGAPFPRFVLSLLGGFELTGPDGIVDLPSRKLAGLLAYLACTAPQPQSREKLAALFWGSHLDAQAKQNLRQALFRLRKMLGENALESDGEVVSLNEASVLCDVGRFEALIRDGSRDALSAAVDLYRGRLIDDVTVGEESWNEWLTGERERVLNLALGAMMGLGEQELVAGRAEHALKAGQRAITLNNLREDAHRLIVQALTATGRRAEALKHYQDLVAVLKRELNTEPDAATRSLVAELRSTRPPSVAGASAKPAMPQSDQPTMAVRSFASANIKEPPGREVIPAKLGARGDEASSAMAVRSGGFEQRQLTIMACNIVGSMPLSTRLDPEDIHDLVAAFHKVVGDAAARFDGYAAQYLSDGVLVYFGYPTAHEHDAEQAVRAGAAILEAVGTLKASSGEALRTSVGIATGLVVVAERPATGDTQQRVAVGEAPTVAGQLQAVASPGTILIAASTHRLVGRMFDCRALDSTETKGLPQSTEAWEVRGETAGVSRFEARRTGALSPLMGRQDEIELLLRRWDQAKAGDGRVVLLCGEPGIGKSRIAEHLLAAREGEPYACLRYFCSPHHTHSPLYPLIAQLERAAGFEPGGSTTAKLDRLEALLKPTATNLPRDVALIAELLGVPADERYPALAVSPQQKREMTFTALLDQLDGAAAQGPVLILFEDIHWSDPTSLDLLDRLIARAATIPVLLIVTFRPEFRPTWVGQPHVTMLPLSRLDRRDSAGIVGGITNGKTLPDAVVEQVLARADGVPLFVEELMSALLESGLLRETADHFVLDGPLPPRAIPTTLRASLVARLDRLASVKAVAQIGAAIGREFSHELIGAVASLTPAALDAALERLTVSGLVSRRGTPPIAIYTFKHALVQDAAYATMLKSRRRQLHASIAKVLVEQFPVVTETLPEAVAHHFTEAELAGEATAYWLRAGQLASARSAYREAVTSFEQALAALEHLPETREILERAIDLRFELRNALVPLGEFERVFSYLREAEGLARMLDDQRRLGETSVHMCHNLWMTGRHAEALAFGHTAHAIAETLGDVPLQVTGDLHLGAACLGTGDYRAAEAPLLKVVQLLDGELSRERFGLAGFPAVMARGYLTSVFGDRGKFDEGIAHGEEGIRLADTLDHPYSLTVVCWYLAHLQIARGELNDAFRLLERGLAVAREWNLTTFSVGNTGIQGYVHALLGRTAEAIPSMEHTLSALETIGHRLAQSFFLVFLGEAYMLADRLDDAHTAAEQALTFAREGGQRPYEAQALRLLGEVFTRCNSPQVADDRYRDALTLAEELDMRPLVARCHHGLARLYQRTIKPDRAHGHFATATAMYREMGMRFWLEQAEGDMLQLQQNHFRRPGDL